jgi:hypothetical protein
MWKKYAGLLQKKYNDASVRYLNKLTCWGDLTVGAARLTFLPAPSLRLDKEHHHGLPRLDVLGDIPLIPNPLQGEDPKFGLLNPGSL